MREFAYLACLAACCLALPVAAQPAPDAAEPDTVQLAAAKQVLREERELQRLTLSDGWMKHLDREERETLQVQRYLGVTFFALSAVGWTAPTFANEADHGPRGFSLVLGGAAALSLGLLATQLFLSDDYEAKQVGGWGVALEFAGLGAAGLFYAGG